MIYKFNNFNSKVDSQPIINEHSKFKDLSRKDILNELADILAYLESAIDDNETISINPYILDEEVFEMVLNSKRDIIQMNVTIRPKHTSIDDLLDMANIISMVNKKSKHIDSKVQNIKMDYTSTGNALVNFTMFVHISDEISYKKIDLSKLSGDIYNDTDDLAEFDGNIDFKDNDTFIDRDGKKVDCLVYGFDTSDFYDNAEEAIGSLMDLVDNYYKLVDEYKLNGYSIDANGNIISLYLY